MDWEVAMVLKVIGAGFGRTGTMSLRDALNELGFGPCYHMSEVIAHPHFAGYWARLARGETVDWDEVFEGYQSTVDWPACTYWRELADHYPDAKVILTVRDPDKWYESTRQTIFSDEHLAMFSGDDVDPDFRDMIDRVYNQTFDGQGHERDYAIAVYITHNDEVMSSIARNRLLVFNPADGWEPLCRFLEVPVPDMPFPRVNTTEDWLAGLHGPPDDRR